MLDYRWLQLSKMDDFPWFLLFYKCFINEISDGDYKNNFTTDQIFLTRDINNLS